MVCDVSPPRGGAPGALDDLDGLGADFLSVAYSPGQSVRVNPVFAAKYLSERYRVGVIFSLATRDMNRIAIQSLLLGASWSGLENVAILRGDPIRPRDRDRVRPVNDYTTTALVSDIVEMNHGRDFRGLGLAEPTGFCPGATVDLGRDLDAEIELAVRKSSAGAEFLLCQTRFDAAEFQAFSSRLSEALGPGRPPTMFAGVQILVRDGIDFGNVPRRIRQEMGAGGSGLQIAIDYARELWNHGVRAFYIIPPILKGGIRDYPAAGQLIRSLKSMRPD